MRKRVVGAVSAGMVMLGLMLGAAGQAAGQAVTAVPQVDMGRYVGVWYEVARYPTKKEKTCVSDTTVLYALGDKARQFQMVTSCRIRVDYSDAWNANGKLDKAGDGRLTVTYIWPFSAKYWVLAVGPGYEWALVGSPNHKTLWVLSRTAALKPEVLDAIRAKAAAEGFDVGKLVMTAQHP
jgi:apolipoprotein D and lipocalin family protein